MPAEPIDPAPFLSTITTASAALVAIVGGLLVARFVTLDSEQEGAQRVLDDAVARHDVARARVEEARCNRLAFEVNLFFNSDAVKAVNAGTMDATSLREVGGSASWLSDEEIEWHAAVVDDELAQADETLTMLLPGDSTSGLTWKDFQKANPGLPIGIEEAWEIKFWSRLAPPRTPQNHSNPLSAFQPRLPSMIKTPDTVILRRGARRDELRAQDERASHRLEDLEGEVERLRLARDAIVKPRGLAIGLLILSFFTVVGVVVPLFIMSERPEDLSREMANTVFGLFLTGLVALLGYMGGLAVRLTKSRSGADAADQHRSWPQVAWLKRLRPGLPGDA